MCCNQLASQVKPSTACTIAKVTSSASLNCAAIPIVGRHAAGRGDPFSSPSAQRVRPEGIQLSLHAPTLNSLIKPTSRFCTSSSGPAGAGAGAGADNC